MGKSREKSKQGGFMIVLVLTAIATVAVVTVLILSQYKHRTKNVLYNNATFIGQQITNRLFELVRDQQAWKHTLYANSTFNCLVTYSVGGCVPAQSYGLGAGHIYVDTQPNAAAAFVLKDNTGMTYYDGTSATAGFDTTGNVCTGTNTFNAASGSDKCPYHAVLYWVADSSCTALVICNKYTVYGYVLYKPRTTSDYQVPYKVGVDTGTVSNSGLGIHSFSQVKSVTKTSGYCCSITCKNTGAGGATAGNSASVTITQTVYQYQNCYPGSTEVAVDVCDRTIYNTAGDTEWTPDKTVTPTYTNSACVQDQ